MCFEEEVGWEIERWQCVWEEGDLEGVMIWECGWDMM
jgi:hypothetical protein